MRFLLFRTVRGSANNYEVRPVSGFGFGIAHPVGAQHMGDGAVALMLADVERERNSLRRGALRRGDGSVRKK